MITRSTSVAFATVLLLCACGGSAGHSRPGEPAPARRSDVVTQEELGNVVSSSMLFDALRALRPAWFRRHPMTLRPDAEGDIVVYLDQNRLGGPESLRSIAIASVTLVRHYSPADAQARFGLGHIHGAIQVVTSR